MAETQKKRTPVELALDNAILTTNISCGVRTFGGVNSFLYATFSGNVDVKTCTKRAKALQKYIQTNAVRARYRFVVASLRQSQENEIALLLKAGFKQSTEWSVNPNSGNQIAIFTYKVK
jgi:hypothetical protein